MSTTYIPADLRRLVATRARSRCEYCLIHEDDTAFSHHCDHIISEKHGGPTIESNLAWCCSHCNIAKGSDIASITPSGRLTPLFNPRCHRCNAHFQLTGDRIEPFSNIGTVTVRLLEFNTPDQIAERQFLILLGRYPRR
ncbi:hypothetical protein IAD21_03475 [Abditibacteriota bacterium]|nr:hypothetical protein IAD21_03475 [Abditibacteriota bacterium]